MRSIEKRFLNFINEETHIELTKEKNINRENLIEWCLELGLDKPNEEESNLLIKDKLLQSGITYLDFYNRFKDRAYGIHPSRFENRFKVNSYQRRKMIETKFLNIAYYKDEEIYPKRIEKVPFIDSEQYFNLNYNDIELWRANNIKGYDRQQLKLDI